MKCPEGDRHNYAVSGAIVQPSIKIKKIKNHHGFEREREKEREREREHIPSLPSPNTHTRHCSLVGWQSHCTKANNDRPIFALLANQSSQRSRFFFINELEVNCLSSFFLIKLPISDINVRWIYQGIVTSNHLFHNETTFCCVYLYVCLA